MSPKNYLSKSQYIRGLQCPKALWLYRHNFELMRKTPASLQRIFAQGHAVGEIARQRFPGGILIKADHRHTAEALEETAAALNSGASILYEAAFLADNTLVRTDILVKQGLDSWSLYEVKSAAEVKDIHIQDIAVQRHVAERTGLKVSSACLMHMNNRYTRKGSLELEKLFAIVNLTDETLFLKHGISVKLTELAKIVLSNREPPTGIGQWCSAPHDCDFYEHCWKDIPDYSIYDLKHLSWEKLVELRQKGVMEIRDIPDGFPLSPQQALQLLAEKNQKAQINHAEISKHLRRLRYPLHFLDFETISPAIPPYDNSRPLEQLPFQASLHVQDRPESGLRHLEYLGNGREDPRPGLVDFLCNSTSSSGSVIAYNKEFEGMCLRVLAEHFPDRSKELLAMRQRLWDSAESFSKAHFVHPGFKGKWSIKKVLPVLVPEMTYAGLAVANGEDAQAAYIQLMSGKLSPEEAERLMAGLKEYCGQDTLAMVRLVEVLRNAVA
ncbi:MAG: DUF2779 domain-containing protein [Elusimicrobia bacterium]|nr:DUF2779 domain-containing protein [Elusimicrobiota bacterium]